MYVHGCKPSLLNIYCYSKQTLTYRMSPPLGLEDFPATLNNRSIGAVDAGIPKTLTATLNMLISTFFIKCLSTSTSTNASGQQILERFFLQNKCLKCL